MKSPNDLKKESQNSMIFRLEGRIEVAIQNGENSVEVENFRVDDPYVIKALKEGGYKILRDIDQTTISWELG